MIRNVLEKEVIALLRNTALEGSRRAVSFADPLGEQGIGLDSLGFVQFITALENAYQVEFPDDFWLETGRISLQDLTNWLVNCKGRIETISDDPIPVPPVETETTRLKELADTLHDRGWLGGIWWAVSRVCRRLRRMFYYREELYILEFDLMNESIPDFPVPPGVEFRVATVEDLPATEGLWPPRTHKRKQRLFSERLARGYSCYTAWQDGRIVAIDWASITGDHEPKTGLLIKLNPGTCYGLDLDEHPQYRSRGLGLAILAYSLHQCKARGNHTQYTIVHADNEKMLRAAGQLFGYRTVGKVFTKRLLWRKSTVWQIDDRRGDDGILEL